MPQVANRMREGARRSNERIMSVSALVSMDSVEYSASRKKSQSEHLHADHRREHSPFQITKWSFSHSSASQTVSTSATSTTTRRISPPAPGDSAVTIAIDPREPLPGLPGMIQWVAKDTSRHQDRELPSWLPERLCQRSQPAIGSGRILRKKYASGWDGLAP
jgi:hypothetical protein